MQRNPLFPRSFSRKQGAGFPLGADAERVASQSSANYLLHTERGASLNTGESASQNYSETRVTCVFAQKIRGRRAHFFGKREDPPDRLSSSSFDAPSTWLSNLGSQHHKGYQGENSQHVGSPHDIARSLPDSQVAGKGLRRDANMPGERAVPVSIKAVVLTLASMWTATTPNIAHTSQGTLLTRPSINSDAVPSAECAKKTTAIAEATSALSRRGRLAFRLSGYAAALLCGHDPTRNDTSVLARSQSLFGGTRRTVPHPTSAVCPVRVRILCSGKARTCGSRWYESWSPP